MATYTVKAPDGKTITLQGPDGASQSDIIAQAQALYKPSAPAPVAKPAPVAPQTPDAYTKLWANKDPKALLGIYQGARSQLAARYTDPAKQAAALTKFDADPRMQAMRKIAGLAPVSTRQQDVRQVARQSLDQRINSAGADIGKNTNAFQGASAGISRGMFGIPEVVAAAAERFLPASVTGNHSNASFSNILQMIRAKDTAAINAHPEAGLAGELGGGIVGGGAAGKIIGGTAGRVAATADRLAATGARGLPTVARVARAVEGIGTLRKGQKIRNIAKLATIGGAAGGAQAAGEGKDVIAGAETGAIAAPALGVGASAIGKFVLRPAADVLGLSRAGSYLRRFTTSTTAQMQQRLAEFRARTGAEPTLLELLPAADRNKLVQHTIAGRDPAIEQASNAIRDRAANVQPEMADVVNAATTPQRRLTQRGMVRALTDANGGTPVPGDAALALRATQSPTDMLHLRRVESQRIMAPHDAAVVADDFSHLIPQHPVQGANGTITMTESDPEVSRAIRSVAGNAPGRRAFTVQDVTNMISDLRDDAAHGGIEGRAADRAAHHLMDVVSDVVPEAGAATHQMRTAYAAHSRMAEGMGEGWQQRLRDEIQVGTSNNRARGVANAYDTDEGVAGRQVGQTNRLLSDLSGTPQSAVSNTVNLARNGNPAIAENLGQNAADEIQGAAREQAQSMEALSSAQRTATSGEGTSINPEDITTGLLALGPHPFAKARILRKLMSASPLPASKARVVVDMLLSQDPRLTARAVNALGNEPGGAAFLKSLAAGAGVVGADTDSNDLPDVGATPAAPPATPPVAPPADDSAAPAGDDNAAQAQAVLSGGDSPYAEQLSNVYAEESPELIDLIQRVKGQEHGTDKSGNFLTSPAGAVGPMQVMPDTAPEAAALAGVPFDDKAYRSDPAYNELIGIAYLSELLRKYDGDVARALAAYNAGPGAADHAMARHGSDWLAAMPAETQDYVARVG